MSPWTIILLISAVSLVILGAIVVGSRVRFGPLVVCAGASAAVFAVFWFLLGGINGLYGNGPSGPIPLLLLYGGLLLMFAAWTLALDASTRARHWQWVGLLTVAGVALVAAVLISISPPDPCIFGQRFGPSDFSACTPKTLAQLLVTAGYFAGPDTALAYGLGFRGAAPRPNTLPEGLTVSRVGTEDDGYSQLEVSTEPL
jgi:hypothetical protein